MRIMTQLAFFEKGVFVTDPITGISTIKCMKILHAKYISVIDLYNHLTMKEKESNWEEVPFIGGEPT